MISAHPCSVEVIVGRVKNKIPISWNLQMKKPQSIGPRGLVASAFLFWRWPRLALRVDCGAKLSLNPKSALQ